MITINEAIKLLEIDTSGVDYDYEPKLADAEKLGIEALKLYRNVRDYPSLSWVGHLPGETPDAGSK